MDKINHHDVIEALAREDATVNDGPGVPDEALDAIRTWYRDCQAQALASLDVRGDYATDLLEPHNVVDAIDALGECEAATVYAAEWQRILEEVAS